jgi:hypothetical protein
MILIRIEIATTSHLQTEHRIIESENEIEDIKNELRMTKERLPSYYDYCIAVEDLEEVKIDELRGLTLREVKMLLEFIT